MTRWDNVKRENSGGNKKNKNLVPWSDLPTMGGGSPKAGKKKKEKQQRLAPSPEKTISLLVPFRTHQKDRQEVWTWLKHYYHHALPEAEVIIGTDHGRPFSKTAAVNDAARRAKGDIFVILDADCFISVEAIRKAAARIRFGQRHGVKSWYVPYRHLYRLTKDATRTVLDSSPEDPYTFYSPPPVADVLDTTGSLFGHKFGALIMMMPREAYETVGCMDPRFRGWGGEDVSFLRALDTLYAKHKNLPVDVFHMYHDKKGKNWKDAKWEGQHQPRVNEVLATRYNKATHKPVQMRMLVDEGCAWDGDKKKARARWVLWSFVMIAAYLVSVLYLFPRWF